MMMPSHLDLGFPSGFPPSFPFDCPFNLLDLSDHIAAAATASAPLCVRRPSRTSNGAGSRNPNPMRVTKPSSASNSPRSIMPVNRRRTTMSGEGVPTRRNLQQQQSQQQAQAQAQAQAQQQPPTEVRATTPTLGGPNFADPVQYTAAVRPLSWHPGFFPQVQQQQQPSYQHPRQYPFPTLPQQQQHLHDSYDLYCHYPAFSPAQTTTYSSNTSPSSFSPLALPSSGFKPATATATSCLAAEQWDLHAAPQHSTMPGYISMPSYNTEPFPSIPSYAVQGTATSTMATSTTTTTATTCAPQWSGFAMQAFQHGGPPTPELLPHPSLQSRPVGIPHQQAEEDSGEVLVGMGLYDEPDKYLDDPHLQNSRSSMSLLIDDTQSAGKGLKLEETWQPPESDDDEEENDDEDDSEEGEDSD